jgi:hypothetical protein
MKHAYILGVALCLSFFVGCAEDPNIEDKTACEASPCSNGGVCSEVGEGFECACPIGFGGLTCELELGDPCDPNPCLNGSTCSAGDAGYACECADGFSGDNCETFEGGPCDPNPCLNGGACSSTADGSTICGCPDGFEGDFCENEVSEDPCSPNPCQNGGTCSDNGDGTTSCACADGFEGDLCDTVTPDNPCEPNPCQNGGECTDLGDSLTACTCPEGFEGDLCENEIFPDPCLENECQNGGACVDNGDGTASCVCPEGFTGDLCEEEVIEDPCAPNPCANGGTCIPKPDGISCICPAGWEGQYCELPVGENPCINAPCQNGGICTDTPEGGYQCQCVDGFFGLNCENAPGDGPCAQAPCLNGGNCTEVPLPGGYDCSTAQGVAGCAVNAACEAAVCAVDSYCCNNSWDSLCASCADGTGGTDPAACLIASESCAIPGGELTYECSCLPDYFGENCENESQNGCSPNPCLNGGTCNKLDEVGGFDCVCPDGFTGSLCDVELGPGVFDASMGGTMVFGHHGACEGWNDCGSGDGCAAMACSYYGYAIVLGYDVVNHSVGGGCTDNQNWSLFNDANTLDEGWAVGDCSWCPLNGVANLMCTNGFPGSCEPNPCQNGGVCTSVGADLYTCECEGLFKGQNCELESNPCDPDPCQNGSTCVALDTDNYTCECPEGFVGEQCDLEDPCFPNPCQNGGTCTVSADLMSFKCECTADWYGETCEDAAVNGCNPDPCQNGGVCTSLDIFGSYDCECPLGYTGTDCETPLGPGVFDASFGGTMVYGHHGACSGWNDCGDGAGCAAMTCNYYGYGIVVNFDEITHSVGGGCTDMQQWNLFNSPDALDEGWMTGNCNSCNLQGVANVMCTNGLEGSCEPNPCQNGGTCNQIEDNLYNCACEGVFTGLNCETEMNPCDPDPCANGGTCVAQGPEAFVCECDGGFVGEQCQFPPPCDPNPCLNGGTCLGQNDGSFVCECAGGYLGTVCDIAPPDPCVPNPCQNGGTCTNGPDFTYTCECPDNTAGVNCEMWDTGDEFEQSFGYTGSVQEFVVPEGVTTLTLQTVGGQGGGSNSCVGGDNGPQDDGGLGGYARGKLAVNPGDIVHVYVGGQGLVGTDQAEEGGWNGGGDGGDWGGGGGGASDVRLTLDDLNSRVVVAGGGGGGNTGCPEHGSGGSGGGLDGEDGDNGGQAFTPGGGGGQANGGAAGENGSAGDFGMGANPLGSSYHFAGGGGGWYGGGSAYAAGAGGGSSYIGGVIDGVTEVGKGSGNGSVTISWNIDTPPCSKHALKLDGSSCLTADVFNQSLSEMTVEMWVRIDNLTPDFPKVQYTLLENIKGQEKGYGFELNVPTFGANPNYVSWKELTSLSDDGATSESVNQSFMSAPQMVQGEWTHLAVVRTWGADGAVLCPYVNGVKYDCETQADFKEFVGNGETVQIGCNDIGGGNFGLEGAMDEMRISSVARYDVDFDPAQTFVKDDETVTLFHFDEEEFKNKLNAADPLSITGTPVLGEPADSIACPADQ